MTDKATPTGDNQSAELPVEPEVNVTGALPVEPAIPEPQLPAEPEPEHDLDIDVAEPLVLPAELPVEEPAPIPTPLTEADLDLDVDTGEELMQGIEAPAEVSKTASNEHVHMTEACTKELKNGLPDGAHFIVMPGGTREEITTVIEIIPDAKDIPNDSRHWAQMLVSGLTHMVRDDQFMASLQQGKWVQGVKFEGRKITVAMPPVGKIPANTILGGNDAVQHMSRELGMYGKIQIPLMHTGIWVDVEVPLDGELHVFEQLLANQEFDLGYLSKGMIYSNTMVKLNIELANFVLDRVVASTVKDMSRANLKRLIKVTDLQIMAWAMATAAFPTGFPYGRACVADPTKCTEVTRETLRLAKLIWTNEEAFSPWQLKFMASRGVGKYATAEDLTKYQDEFIKIGQRDYQITPTLTATFETPSLEQYELSGYEWVDGICSTIKTTLMDLSTTQMNQAANTQYMLTSMRQYSHWVKRLTYANGVIVEDRDAIANSLGVASSNKVVTDAFIAGVKLFIDDSSAVIVGIPKYDCPKCGAPAGQDTKFHPFVIPLDAVHTFFTLRDLKIRTTLLANMGH